MQFNIGRTNELQITNAMLLHPLLRSLILGPKDIQNKNIESLSVRQLVRQLEQVVRFRTRQLVRQLVRC